MLSASRTGKSRFSLLNEEETISLIWKVFSRGDPFSDDAAWVTNQKENKFVVAKADMFVEETDAPPTMSPAQMASKAITSAVSDFAAKGARPSFCFVSLGIPKDRADPDFVRSLARGFQRAARRYGLRIIGGDTNASAGGVVIDVPIFGFANSIVKRGGSHVGDCVGVSGKFGLQASGLRILLGKAGATDESFEKKAVKRVLEPVARLDLGLSISEYLSASIDSSDGLAISLYHLAEAGRVNIDLDKIPMEPGVEEFARSNKLEANDLALFGGEEYELVVTFPPGHRKTLEREGIITIGSVTSRGSSKRSTVFLKGKKIPRKGWLHNRG